MDASPPPAPRLRRWIPWLLFAATVLTFLPSLRGEFLNWDDDFNFTNNPDYRGLSPGHLKWMATAFVTGHWHPLTWLTLGLDYTLWRMNPVGYHLTSVLIHGANAVLLFLVLESLLRLLGRSGPPWPALIGAAFYALHPLRVESVAWITERRDVLCGFFTLLCVLAYFRRAEEERAGRPGTRWLAISIAAFGASLMSKALSITLPGALLLLDVYPLGRFQPGRRPRILLEKLPYLLLSFADAAIMQASMRAIHGIQPIAGYDVPQRLAQASYGLCFYLVKSLWPSQLRPLYRLEPHLDPKDVVYLASMAAVALVTVFLVVRRRQLPAVLVAWLSYAGLLLPVLGLAATGMQIAADRYTYLAAIPGSMLLAAGLAGVPAVALSRVAAGAAALLLLLAGLTARQCGFWKDSETLWTRQVTLDAGGSVAWFNRAVSRQARGDMAGALEDYNRVFGIEEPPDAKPWVNRGIARALLGDHENAIADFDQALRREPESTDALLARARSKAKRGDAPGADADLAEALRLKPGVADIYGVIGLVRLDRGDLPGALAAYTKGLELQPASAEQWRNRGLVQTRMGKPAEAVADYTKSLELRPDHAETLADRGTARGLAGNTAGALEDFGAALRLKPDAALYFRRASLLGLTGNWKGVVDDCSEAIRLKPGYLEAYVRRGMARMEQGDSAAAARDFETALQSAPPGWPQRGQVEKFLQRARGK
jgi:tetratricopeptide (TPR) repeat protein